MKPRTPTAKSLDLLKARPKPDHHCPNCRNGKMEPSEGFVKQGIPGQPDEHKVLEINSPHWECPKCRFAALFEGQADELRRRVNLAVYGIYKPLVTGAPYLEPISDYLQSKDREPFTFRFVNLPQT